jgi:hypothetical protein
MKSPRRMRGMLASRLTAAFERGLAVAAQGSLLSFQAFALVAPRLCVGAEMFDIPGAGLAESPPLTHPAHADPRGAAQKADTVAHAEKMARVTAVRLLRPTGTQGNRKRESEKGGETLAGPHGNDSMTARQI